MEDLKLSLDPILLTRYLVLRLQSLCQQDLDPLLDHGLEVFV